MSAILPNTPVPTTVQNTIPAYLYWQYADDSDLQAFMASFNAMAQQYVNTFNQLNLPAYAGNPLVVGALLDWVAEGIYGIPRPVLTTGLVQLVGPYDTVPYDTQPYDGFHTAGTLTQLTTSDDVFKRILTWNLYRGDGKVFNITWLKRRVLRFLNGLNGTDPDIDQTYQISVTQATGNVFNINLTAWEAAFPSSNIPTILQAAMKAGALNVPFTYTFNVVL